MKTTRNIIIVLLALFLSHLAPANAQTLKWTLPINSPAGAKGYFFDRVESDAAGNAVFMIYFYGEDVSDYLGTKLYWVSNQGKVLYEADSTEAISLVVLRFKGTVLHLTVREYTIDPVTGDKTMTSPLTVRRIQIVRGKPVITNTQLDVGSEIFSAPSSSLDLSGMFVESVISVPDGFRLVAIKRYTLK